MTTLLHGADRAIARGRAAMVGLYTDRCLVTRDAVVGEPEYVTNRAPDPVTLQIPGQGQVTVYKGPCRMQVKVDINSNVVSVVTGEREATYLTGQMQVPVEVEELTQFSDRDTFDGTGFLGNPGLIDVNSTALWMVCPYDSMMVGREFRIAGPYHKSQAVYRRFRVNEAV
jgi:hypothetical protein